MVSVVQKGQHFRFSAGMEHLENYIWKPSSTPGPLLSESGYTCHLQSYKLFEAASPNSDTEKMS